MKRLLLLTAILNLMLLKLYGQQDLSKPFKACDTEGSITLYDYNAKKWISSDINDSHYPTLPASTFPHRARVHPGAVYLVGLRPVELLNVTTHCAFHQKALP